MLDSLALHVQSKMKAIDFKPGNLYDRYGSTLLVLYGVSIQSSIQTIYEVKFLCLESGETWRSIFYENDILRGYQPLDTSEQ